MFPAQTSLLEVVDLSLQACSNVTHDDVPMLGECCPSGRDYSLNLLVLVFVTAAVTVPGRHTLFSS